MSPCFKIEKNLISFFYDRKSLQGFANKKIGTADPSWLLPKAVLLHPYEVFSGRNGLTLPRWSKVLAKNNDPPIVVLFVLTETVQLGKSGPPK